MNFFENLKKESEEKSNYILREVRKRLHELERRELVPKTIMLDIRSYDQLKAYAGYNQRLEIKTEYIDLPLYGVDPRRLDEVRVYWNKDYAYFEPEAFSKADKLFGLPVIAVMTGMQLIQISI